VRTGSQNQIHSSQCCDLRLSQARLYSHQQEGVIPTTGPAALVRHLQQRIDLRPSEERHLTACEALTRNGQNPLYLTRVIRKFESSEAEKGPNCREAEIARSSRDSARLLQILKESGDKWGVNFLEFQARRGLLQPLPGEFQEHPKSIAIGTDGVPADLTLLH
jgi:hypothetical protein